MAAISLKGIEKSYGDFPVVHGIDLEIADREFVVFVGPSGCGKSTTLRMIAGLETITGGDLHIGKRRVNELPPGDRDIAMVFQNYALYPHMTVEQNISFGLRQRKASKQEIDAAVSEAAALLGIEPLLKRKPRALSGGQRQRVAMGRAIVRKPQVFLFDEPLSNLDAKLRVQMRSEIKRLHSLYPTTTVYVTHDQVEAMTMADRVVVMNKGMIEQVGPPQELYKNPATLFVAGFLGSPSMNFLPCSIVGGSTPSIYFNPDLALSLPVARRGLATSNRELVFGVRPEDVTLTSADARGSLTAMVTNVEPLGMETMVFAKFEGTTICVRTSPDVHTRSGNRVGLLLNLEKMHLFDAKSGHALR